MQTAADPKQCVYLVDDDPQIRIAMQALFDSVGLGNKSFASADDFLKDDPQNCAGCLVLDIRMPGLGGLELQDELIARGISLPIIFITGHGDVPMAVEAMQKGAIDFIQKPFRDQELLDCIHKALKSDRENRDAREKRSGIGRRLATLTKREQEVFDLVVTGKPNKVIAYDLGVSQRTVEIHRSRVMEKMQARSLADLVRMHLSI